MERNFLTHEEVAEDLCISDEQAQELITVMRKHLSSAGYITAAGLIQKWYYEEQKVSGFALPQRVLVQTEFSPLRDRRLLSMKDFCNYTSLGKDKAAELAKVSKSVFRVGRRTMVDRVKFDRWCDENTGIK